MRVVLVGLAMIGCVSCVGAEPESELELEPAGQDGKHDGVGACPTVQAAIAPTAPTRYSCGALPPVHAAIMADVNAFWGSQVVGCACGPVSPAGHCTGAWSLFNTGYVYIGVEFLDGLTSSIGTWTPAQMVYAHEFAHEIQGHFNAFAATELQRELMADCLAGYYLGSLLCRGLATEHDVRAALATSCVIADGTGDPVADLDTHGTCEQRMQEVDVGIRAYQARSNPLAACVR